MPDGPSTTTDTIDFGGCRAITLTCVSEIGWASNEGLMQDIASGGGTAASQWRMPWREENERGSSACSKSTGSTVRAGVS